MGSGSDTGHRQTDVNGWADTLVEKLGFQEDLAIGNRDDICWDIGGHITSLGLNDGEGGKGARAVLCIKLGCALKQTGVEIEHITWEGLTTGRASKQEGHLAVSNGLLGEIVIDNKGVLSVVAEVLTNSAAGVGRQELEWSGFGCGSGNDDGVLKAVTLVEESHDVGNS